MTRRTGRQWFALLMHRAGLEDGRTARCELLKTLAWRARWFVVREREVGR